MQELRQTTIVINAQGEILSVEGESQKMFGYAPGELVGQNVNMLMPQPHKAHHNAYLQRYLETGVARLIGVKREFVAKGKDGRDVPVALLVSEKSEGDKPQFTGVLSELVF